MPSRLKIDYASITDNEVARQIEFNAEVDGDEHEFAVRYDVLKELSGDEPENDALELFERFSDEIIDVCAEVLARRPVATVVVVEEHDLE